MPASNESSRVVSRVGLTAERRVRRGARSIARVRVAGLAVAWQLGSGESAALEPRSLTEPDVLREPAAVTQVVDAFDERGVIDFDFTLAYQHSWKAATIVREVQSPGIDAARIAHVEVTDFSESTSRLNLRADVGLFHDLALIVRMPIILSSIATLLERQLPLGVLDGAPGEPLLALPFRSPNRSGVEFLAVGVDWGILNQWREASQPTLVVGAEGRFSVSEPMHACGPAPAAADATASVRRCAYPSDINRNGASGELVTELAPGRAESLEGDFPAEGRKAGVSRGTTALLLHSVVSRRFQHLEPYVGFNLLFEFANEDSDFGGDHPWNDGPPTRGGFSLGIEIMPWEVAEQFQRLSIDVRCTGTYRSEGHDYSELFDALGSAGGESYRRPNFAGYVGNTDPLSQADIPSVVDPDSERVFPTGITRVQGHGAYALRVAGRWQAGQYVHFDLGGALALTQRHLVTLGQPCDGTRASELGRAGPCLGGVAGARTALGAPDPSFRPQIDQPGRRFIVDTASTVDAWVGATVMF